MHSAISEPRDNQSRKKRRVDDGDGEAPSSWYNPSPQPYYLPLPSNHHAAIDQSVQHGEYSTITTTTTTHEEGSSTLPCPPIARPHEGSGEESLVAEEDVALSQCCFGMVCESQLRIYIYQAE